MKYETVQIVVDDETIHGADGWTIIEPVWWTADIYKGPEVYEESLEPFSMQQRLMFVLRWYFSEVSNGGHDQFYGNSTGVVWKDASKAFAELGLKEGEAIIGESADRLGGAPSLDRDARLTQMKQYAPDFSDLDDALYDLCDRVDLDAIMLKFIRANAPAFYFSGEVTRVVLPTTRRNDSGDET